jgi:hypothetical protein
MDNNNPTLAMLVIIDDPPKLINGNVKPVNGKVAVITPILIIA